MVDTRLGLVVRAHTRDAVTQLDRYGRATDDAFVKKTTRARKEVGKLERATTKLGSSVKGLLSRNLGLAALGAVLTNVSSVGIARFVTSTNTAIDTEVKFARLIGVSTQQLREYGFAAERIAGIAAGPFQQGIRRAQRRLGEFVLTGGGEAAAVFEMLGDNIRHADGRTKDILELFPQLNTLFRETADEGERLALAFKLFDTEGAALSNLFSADPKEIAATIERLRELRGVITGDEEGHAEDMANAVLDLKTAWAGFKEELANTFGPDVISGFEKLTALLAEGRKFREENPDLPTALQAAGLDRPRDPSREPSRTEADQTPTDPTAAFFRTRDLARIDARFRRPSEIERPGLPGAPGFDPFTVGGAPDARFARRAFAGQSPAVGPDTPFSDFMGPLPQQINEASDATERLAEAALASAAGLGQFLRKLIGGDASAGDFIGLAAGIAATAVGGPVGGLIAGFATGRETAALRGSGGITLVVTHGAESSVEAINGSVRARRSLHRGLRDEATRFTRTGRLA